MSGRQFKLYNKRNNYKWLKCMPQKRAEDSDTELDYSSDESSTEDELIIKKQTSNVSSCQKFSEVSLVHSTTNDTFNRLEDFSDPHYRLIMNKNRVHSTSNFPSPNNVCTPNYRKKSVNFTKDSPMTDDEKVSSSSFLSGITPLQHKQKLGNGRKSIKVFSDEESPFSNSEDEAEFDKYMTEIGPDSDHEIEIDATKLSNFSKMNGTIINANKTDHNKTCLISGEESVDSDYSPDYSSGSDDQMITIRVNSRNSSGYNEKFNSTIKDVNNDNRMSNINANKREYSQFGGISGEESVDSEYSPGYSSGSDNQTIKIPENLQNSSLCKQKFNSTIKDVNKDNRMSNINQNKKEYNKVCEISISGEESVDSDYSPGYSSGSDIQMIKIPVNLQNSSLCKQKSNSTITDFNNDNRMSNNDNASIETDPIPLEKQINELSAVSNNNSQISQSNMVLGKSRLESIIQNLSCVQERLSTSRLQNQINKECESDSESDNSPSTKDDYFPQSPSQISPRSSNFNMEDQFDKSLAGMLNFQMLDQIRKDLIQKRLKNNLSAINNKFIALDGDADIHSDEDLDKEESCNKKEQRKLLKQPSKRTRGQSYKEIPIDSDSSTCEEPKVRAKKVKRNKKRNSTAKCPRRTARAVKPIDYAYKEFYSERNKKSKKLARSWFNLAKSDDKKEIKKCNELRKDHKRVLYSPTTWMNSENFLDLVNPKDYESAKRN